MGTQTMGSQVDGDGNDNGKEAEFNPLVQQNSMYCLTLDEVQNQLGDLGKPLSSMNLDELLKTVWNAEVNQSIGMYSEGADQATQTALQHQASLSLNGALSKKTVDEVWRDIQQIRNNADKRSCERQPTWGEMTLEDFLVKAGIIAEAPFNKKNAGMVVGVDSDVSAQQFAQESQWMHYPQPQFQHPQQSMMGIYMPVLPIQQQMYMGAGAPLDAPYLDNQVAVPSPLMGTLSDSRVPGRKRGYSEDSIEKTVERRQKRMIKNRESAACSRARKQAYTNELENKVSRLEQENESLRKRKEVGRLLPPPAEPRYQLRRTTSAPF